VNILAPLEDPTYTPVHQPAGGAIPDVVSRWGPRSQLRWFHRFAGALTPQKPAVWDRFYCESEQHRGLCCSSCQGDDYLFWGEPECCCHAVQL
jgi:hypothetical protein